MKKLFLGLVLVFLLSGCTAEYNLTIDDINNMTYDENFERMNEKTVKNEILNQVYVNSKICSYKSKLYNKSIKYIVVTVILTFINYIFC